MENVTIINTNYTKFELMQDETGKVFERHSSYKNVCFSEWEKTAYKNIEDAIQGIYYLYCPDF